MKNNPNPKYDLTDEQVEREITRLGRLGYRKDELDKWIQQQSSVPKRKPCKRASRKVGRRAKS